MGLNDNFSMPAAADDIEAAIGADLQRLRGELPEARLVVVEPFWYTDERPDSVEQIIGWVAAAADRVGADHIAGASRWIEGHPEWMSADGIHPNDEGYAEIAAAHGRRARAPRALRRARALGRLGRRSPIELRRGSPTRSEAVRRPLGGGLERLRSTGRGDIDWS